MFDKVVIGHVTFFFKNKMFTIIITKFGEKINVSETTSDIFIY